MPMTFDERKKALGRGTARRIARELGRHEGHVHYVLKGDRRDELVELMVCDLIGKPRDEVFGPVQGEK